jgi:hypothetical protein
MSTKWHCEESVVLGPKTTLRRGDLFRASGGPYYVTRGGETIYMGDRGIYRFVGVVVQGVRRWIQGQTNDGAMRLVYIGPRRRSTRTGVVYVPHKITRKRDVRRLKGAA